MILEVNAAGQLVLPPELVQAPPHTRLEVGREGDALVVKQVCDPPPHVSILDLPTFAAGLVDSRMTFRREEIYDDDGR